MEEVSSLKTELQTKLSEEVKKSQETVVEQGSQLEKMRQMQEKIDKLTQESETNKLMCENVNKDIRKRDAEMEVTKSCLKQLKIFKNDQQSKETVSKILDAIKIKSECRSLEMERKELQEKLDSSNAKLGEMAVCVEKAEERVGEAEAARKQAKLEREEALSKLAVRTEYFNEKQEELTK